MNIYEKMTKEDKKQWEVELASKVIFSAIKLVTNFTSSVLLAGSLIMPFILSFQRNSSIPLCLLLVPFVSMLIASIWFNTKFLILRISLVIIIFPLSILMRAGLSSKPIFYWIIPIGLFISFYLTQRLFPRMEALYLKESILNKYKDSNSESNQ